MIMLKPYVQIAIVKNILVNKTFHRKISPLQSEICGELYVMLQYATIGTFINKQINQKTEKLL